MNGPLYAASQEGDINFLYTSIQMEPYLLEQIDRLPFIDTPLHIAAGAGHVGFATEIMRLKPSFAWKVNHHGLSPMHLALQNKHYRMVCRFVDINKDLVRVKGREGITPLHVASQGGRLDLVVKFLTACPGSIEDVTVRSESALHIAVRYNQFPALEVLVRWLQRNCQRHAHHQEKRVLDWKDEAGNTILHLSVIQGFPQAVRLLIDSKIDINAKNLDGLTALDIAENQIHDYNVEIRNMLTRGGAVRGFSLAAPLLEEDLKAKITLNEKIAICATRLRRRISNDTRNALLVVAILFATTTYDAILQPPGGVYEANTGASFVKSTSASLKHVDDEVQQSVGKVGMKPQTFFFFWSFNSCSFYLSILMICLLMPRGRVSAIMTYPLCMFSGSYMFSMIVISPSLGLTIATMVIPCLLLVLYCWGTLIYVGLAKKLKMYTSKQEDKSKFSGGNKW